MLDYARLSWSDFDLAVEAMAGMVRDLRPAVLAIRGVPRGGLPLAVALSHYTGLPLVDPGSSFDGIVVVDDVVESGKTFYELGCPATMFLCWVSKNPEVPVRSVVSLPKSSWVVFPWEASQEAVSDAEAYYKRRRGEI